MNTTANAGDFVAERFVMAVYGADLATVKDLAGDIRKFFRPLR
jgi:hypothetical protein